MAGSDGTAGDDAAPGEAALSAPTAPVQVAARGLRSNHVDRLVRVAAPTQGLPLETSRPEHLNRLPKVSRAGHDVGCAAETPRGLAIPYGEDGIATVYNRVAGFQEGFLCRLRERQSINRLCLGQ